MNMNQCIHLIAFSHSIYPRHSLVKHYSISNNDVKIKLFKKKHKLDHPVLWDQQVVGILKENQLQVDPGPSAAKVLKTYSSSRIGFSSSLVKPNEIDTDMPFGICLFYPAHNMLSRRKNKPLNKCVFNFRSKTLIMEE